VIRKLPKPNERLFQKGLKELAQVMKRPGDLSWQDHIPEAPEIPQEPDEVIAVVVPKKTPSRRKPPAR
jgi:hypothetical protein